MNEGFTGKMKVKLCIGPPTLEWPYKENKKVRIDRVWAIVTATLFHLMVPCRGSCGV